MMKTTAVMATMCWFLCRPHASRQADITEQRGMLVGRVEDLGELEEERNDKYHEHGDPKAGLQGPVGDRTRKCLPHVGELDVDDACKYQEGIQNKDGNCLCLVGYSEGLQSQSEAHQEHDVRGDQNGDGVAVVRICYPGQSQDAHHYLPYVPAPPVVGQAEPHRQKYQAGNAQPLAQKAELLQTIQSGIASDAGQSDEVIEEYQHEIIGIDPVHHQETGDDEDGYAAAEKNLKRDVHTDAFQAASEVPGGLLLQDGALLRPDDLFCSPFLDLGQSGIGSEYGIDVLLEWRPFLHHDASFIA